MMVAMKRVKWDGTTTGSSLAGSVAKVYEELKARLLFKARYLIPCSLCGLNTKVRRGRCGRHSRDGADKHASFLYVGVWREGVRVML